MEDDYVKGRGGVRDEVTEHVHLCNVEFYTSKRDDRIEEGQEAMASWRRGKISLK